MTNFRALQPNTFSSMKGSKLLSLMFVALFGLTVFACGGGSTTEETSSEPETTATEPAVDSAAVVADSATVVADSVDVAMDSVATDSTATE